MNTAMTLTLRKSETPDYASLDQYLDGVTHLPPTPALMVKLIGLFRQPECDADEIVQLARRDPALSAEILRRCNTSFFGSNTQIKDINEAVFRLGFYELYQITMNLFGLRAMEVNEGGRNFPLEKLRHHASITAITAGAIAKEVRESEGVAFTAGLLHDIGKVALVFAESAKYSPLCERHGWHGELLCEAEKIAFGFDHGHLGSRLLTRWGVPEEIAQPVWEHHRPGWSGKHADMAAILHMANLLAHHIQDEEAGYFFERPESWPVIGFLQLSPEQSATLETLVRNSVKHLSSLVTA